MSWSATATEVTVKNFDKATYVVVGEPPEDQLAAAKTAAHAIITSGAVGAASKHTFQVTLNGHANPKHMPADGYVNDGVAATVWQE